MAGNNNGSSYQQDDNGGGHYVAIPNGESSPGRKARLYVIGGVAVVVILAMIVGYAVESHNAPAKAVDKLLSADSKVEFKDDGKLKLFDDLNRYVMEDYDAKSTFASFLPGVAGHFGKPVWSFYVNRGQAVSTFGTESKDYPILEFNAANKAYQMTAFWGFRTFLTGTRSSLKNGGVSFQMEPFAPANTRELKTCDNENNKPKRILFVGANDVEIQEIDGAHGVTTNVNYFVLPETNFAALVRRVTFTNTGDSDLTLDIMDGLAKMEPFGGALDGMLKSMGRTLEGWMGVYHADNSLNMPFYKLSTEPSDTASVKIEEAGHYCLSFITKPGVNSELLPIVYDTRKIFGSDTSLERPVALWESSVAEILNQTQYGWATTSSAFAAASKVTLKPGENVTLASVFGKADHIDVVPRLASVVTAANFVSSKFERARTLINEVTAVVETETNNPLFDGTIKQMFLDNSLRGGVPTILGDVESSRTYDEAQNDKLKRVQVMHVYSRIHGDLERDYNAFNIAPSYFSNGPGNYRDVAQNRRNDVTFYPRIGSFNIQMFLSYIQADGYEPLTVEAVVYRYENPVEAEKIAKKLTADAKSAEVLGDVLKGGAFRPGQIFDLCDQLNIQRNLQYSDAEFINMILEKTEDRAMALFGTGYWADHWDYYMDFINSYLSVFPDGEEELMYDKPLRFFFSTATVKPRSEKYVLDFTQDGKGHHVLQLDSTYYDSSKADEQQAFLDQNTGLLGIEANWQRTNDGQPFMVSAIAKLFGLGAIKFAMRDAWGMGVEYEGGRPGWLDSMNGLPGMVGSGMPETYELKLLLQYVKKVVDTYKRPVVIASELHKMIKTVNKALDKLIDYGYKEEKDPSLHVPLHLFQYWDVVAAARESYRNDVQYYFSGNTTTIGAQAVSEMVDNWLAQIELGIDRAFKFSTKGYGDDGKSGVPACFFAYEITDWELNGNRNDKGLPLVNARAMKLKVFPQFLEGPVRYMKTIEDDHEKMEDMYNRVLTSGLRDTKLDMYFLSASLKGQSYDMGRQISFAPGWLENQSIWMHMSYKYYLQLLRGKLYKQFYSEMKNGGMLPFMDPLVYGRSLMECSSFIASSAFPDPSIVGTGYLARLSGSTAEYLDMYKLMFIGPELFYLNDSGKLEMQLVPALPSWVFDDENSEKETMYDKDGNPVVKFKLFGSILVTYHNPGGVNRYGENPKSYTVAMDGGAEIVIDGPTIPTDTAETIRRATGVKSIDAFF